MASKASNPSREKVSPELTYSHPKPTTQQNIVTAVKVAVVALVSIAALWALDQWVN